jgi:hypothetical protein
MSSNTGTTHSNPLNAPINSLNSISISDTDKVVNDDLYSILKGATDNSLKPTDTLGYGELKGVVLAIIETHRSLTDKEQADDASRTETPDSDVENSSIGDPGSQPYGYVVNIPELCFMLPAPPSIESPTYNSIVKVYRDHGFTFRIRNDQGASLASVGDIVKVGFKSINNFSGGYYVGRVSRPGSHPGVAPTNPKEKAEKKPTVPPPRPKGDLKTPVYTDKSDYLAKIDNALDDVLKLDCAGKIKRKYTSAAGLKRRQKEHIKSGWPATQRQVDFFKPIRLYNVIVNPYAEKAFLLVRNAMAQEPEILKYMAETILHGYVTSRGRPITASLSHKRKTCAGYAVKVGKCPATHPIQTPTDHPKPQRCYKEKVGNKYKGLYLTTGHWVKCTPTFCDCKNSSLGNHGLGVALDINPFANPMSKKFETDHPPKLQAIFKMYGFRVGSEWRTPDTMHFDFVGDYKKTDALWDKCVTAGQHKHYENNWTAVGPAGNAGKDQSPRVQKVIENANKSLGISTSTTTEAGVTSVATVSSTTTETSSTSSPEGVGTSGTPGFNPKKTSGGP